MKMAIRGRIFLPASAIDAWANEESLEELEFAFIQDGLSIKDLSSFLDKMAKDNNKTRNEIISSALISGEYEKFRAFYAKYSKQQIAV